MKTLRARHAQKKRGQKNKQKKREKKTHFAVQRRERKNIELSTRSPKKKNSENWYEKTQHKGKRWPRRRFKSFPIAGEKKFHVVKKQIGLPGERDRKKRKMWMRKENRPKEHLSTSNE